MVLVRMREASWVLVLMRMHIVGNSHVIMIILTIIVIPACADRDVVGNEVS